MDSSRVGLYEDAENSHFSVGTMLNSDADNMLNYSDSDKYDLYTTAREIESFLSEESIESPQGSKSSSPQEAKEIFDDGTPPDDRKWLLAGNFDKSEKTEIIEITIPDGKNWLRIENLDGSETLEVGTPVEDSCLITETLDGLEVSETLEVILKDDDNSIATEMLERVETPPDVKFVGSETSEVGPPVEKETNGLKISTKLKVTLQDDDNSSATTLLDWSPPNHDNWTPAENLDESEMSKTFNVVACDCDDDNWPPNKQLNVLEMSETLKVLLPFKDNCLTEKVNTTEMSKSLGMTQFDDHNYQAIAKLGEPETYETLEKTPLKNWLANENFDDSEETDIEERHENNEDDQKFKTEFLNESLQFPKPIWKPRKISDQQSTSSMAPSAAMLKLDCADFIPTCVKSNNYAAKYDRGPDLFKEDPSVVDENAQKEYKHDDSRASDADEDITNNDENNYEEMEEIEGAWPLPLSNDINNTTPRATDNDQYISVNKGAVNSLDTAEQPLPLTGPQPHIAITEIQSNIPKFFSSDIIDIGEPLRFLFAYCGMVYLDVRINRDEYSMLAKTIPQFHTPMLIVEGECINHVIPIARYLGTLGGIAGDTPLENMKIDAVVECVNELRNQLVEAYYELDVRQRRRKVNVIRNETAPNVMKALELAVVRNGGYLALKRLTWADIFFAGLIDYMNYISEYDLTMDYESLRNSIASVKELKCIRQWLKLRPNTDA